MFKPKILTHTIRNNGIDLKYKVWAFDSHFMIRLRIELFNQTFMYGFRVNKPYNYELMKEYEEKLKKEIRMKEFIVSYFYSGEMILKYKGVSFEEFVEEFLEKKEEFFQIELFYSDVSKGLYPVCLYRPMLTGSKNFTIGYGAKELSEEQQEILKKYNK